MYNNMKVQKRNGEYEEVSFDKILNRIILSNKPSYITKGYRVYSQNDEDGIIAGIFSDIGIINKTFIEIGIGMGIENNSHYLLLKDWRGLWIDSNKKSISQLTKILPKK